MSEEKPLGLPETPQKSEGGSVQVEGNGSEHGSAPNSPKTSKAIWDKVRLEYEAGSYLSLRQLASKHNITFKTLESRYRRENWKQKKEELLMRVHAKVEQKVVKELSAADSYLLRLRGRGEKYERIIDASMENLGSKASDGTPLLDPDAIDAYTRSEGRVVELMRTALRIAPLSQIDITSGGKDLGSSFVQAIAKLRESNAPKLTEADLAKVLEAEVE